MGASAYRPAAGCATVTSMPETETVNEDRETLSDDQFRRQVMDSLLVLNESVGFLIGARDIDRKQLDHVDTMTHEILQFIEANRPALARATALLGKAQKWKGWQAGTKGPGK